jgi:hypothetical protein
MSRRKKKKRGRRSRRKKDESEEEEKKKRRRKRKKGRRNRKRRKGKITGGEGRGEKGQKMLHLHFQDSVKMEAVTSSETVVTYLQNYAESHFRRLRSKHSLP